MLRLMSYLHTLSLYPAARVIVTAQSEMQRFKTLGQKPKVHFQAPYQGQKIMLLALYEKGTLRSDVTRLLDAARAAGMYILAVNTLKLKDPAALQGRVDCYIERPNFGRDFGSYKSGFLHVFQQGWHEICPRLLMINDSIFFSEKRLPKFLHDMMTSDIEVLGATENYEIEYHLGSFCIAMAQSILKASTFQTYWKAYLLTDVRPSVIKRGEMKLSKTLKRCVSGAEQMRALYSSPRFHSAVQKDLELLNFAIRNARSCSETPARRLNSKTILSQFEDSFLATLYATDMKTLQIEANLAEANSAAIIVGIDDLRDLIKNKLADFSSFDEEKFLETLQSAVTTLFMRHSQIHQNAAVLLQMGLPIIKLDLIYRGMSNVIDMMNLTKQMNYDEAAEVTQLLMDRPYGANVLFGWRRAAFSSGLI